jgi:DNA-binding response OmpR family regulator
MGSVLSLDDEAGSDVIDTYIHRLRKQLANSSAQIMTLRGFGYVLRAKPSADEV